MKALLIYALRQVRAPFSHTDPGLFLKVPVVLMVSDFSHYEARGLIVYFTWNTGVNNRHS